MKWIDYQAEDRLYLQNEAFCRTGLVRHGFTGRLGGVSHGKVTGLNLGFRVGDDPASVQENYRLLGADLGILPEQMVLSRQTHTDTIRPVTDADAGKGLTKESDITDTDGLITDRPSLALVIFTADCVPVLLAGSGAAGDRRRACGLARDGQGDRRQGGADDAGAVWLRAGGYTGGYRPQYRPLLF